MHREEERLEDVDVRLKRNDMALNGTTRNDGTPRTSKNKLIRIKK
jgi:hypothetical protein